jgi:2-aminoadipate transaminase
MYKQKRDIMLKELKKHLPKGVEWNVPKGGMFIWLTLPKKINAHVMFRKALTKKVAYVVGDAFFPEGGSYNTMRLNFSYSDDETIKIGIKRLAEVINEEMQAPYQKEPYMPEGV